MAGGVPINDNKVIWKLVRNAIEDELIFTVEEYNESTRQNRFIRPNQTYSTARDSFVTILASDQALRAAEEPRVELALDSERHDIHRRTK